MGKLLFHFSLEHFLFVPSQSALMRSTPFPPFVQSSLKDLETEEGGFHMDMSYKGVRQLLGKLALSKKVYSNPKQQFTLLMSWKFKQNLNTID